MSDIKNFPPKKYFYCHTVPFFSKKFSSWTFLLKLSNCKVHNYFPLQNIFFYEMGSNFAVWRNTYCYNKSEEEESKSDPNFRVGERCVVTFKLENKIKVLYSPMAVLTFINKIQWIKIAGGISNYTYWTILIS